MSQMLLKRSLPNVTLKLQREANPLMFHLGCDIITFWSHGVMIKTSGCLQYFDNPHIFSLHHPVLLQGTFLYSILVTKGRNSAGCSITGFFITIKLHINKGFVGSFFKLLILLSWKRIWCREVFSCLPITTEPQGFALC